MAANFLHGVETIEVKNGGVPISVVKSAVVGIVSIIGFELILHALYRKTCPGYAVGIPSHGSTHITGVVYVALCRRIP